MVIEDFEQSDDQLIWIPDRKCIWVLAKVIDARKIESFKQDDRIVCAPFSDRDQEIVGTTKRVVKFGDCVIARREETEHLVERRDISFPQYFSEPAFLNLLRWKFEDIHHRRFYSVRIGSNPSVLIQMATKGFGNYTEDYLQAESHDICFREFISAILSGFDDSRSESLISWRQKYQVQSNHDLIFLGSCPVGGSHAFFNTIELLLNGSNSLVDKYRSCKIILKAFGCSKSHGLYTPRYAAVAKLFRSANHSEISFDSFVLDALLLDRSPYRETPREGRPDLTGEEDTSFIVFSSLLNGWSTLSEQTSHRLGLPLGGPNLTQASDVRLSEIESALKVFQVNDSDIEQIWQLLAALVHMSNIVVHQESDPQQQGHAEIQGEGEAEGEDCEGLVAIRCSSLPLEQLADLLGLFKEQFVFKLATQQLVLSGRQPVHTRVGSHPFP